MVLVSTAIGIYLGPALYFAGWLFLGSGYLIRVALKR
jgi:hypothetical protein